MGARGRIKDLWREQRLFEQRSVVAVAVVCLLAAALVARLYWLQVSKHAEYTALAQGNRVRTEPLPAPRGVIYDRAGSILAENRPAYQLELVREQVPDLEATLQGLVRIGLLQADDLEAARRTVRSRRPFDGVPIRLRLDEEDMARFALHRFEFPGVDIRTRLARNYPQGEVGVHALGYVGTISEADLARIDREQYAGTSTIGKTGVEAAFEDALRGRNGSREIMVNAQGRSVERLGPLQAALRNMPGRPGSDLFLTLDLEVQRVAEQAVQGRRAAVVALDPRNGDVITLVSTPGFDPNGFARGLTRAEFTALNENPDRPLFNRALRGTYPPGSTIKPVVALAGLESGVTTTQDPVACPGWFSLPGSSHRFRDWKKGGHGRVSMQQAIAQSCDVYFYSLARTLGVDRLHEFLGRFGLGAATGLDVGGERPGLLPSPGWKRGAFKRPAQQVWFPGETVIFGIGQGYMTSTPMQLAHMTAVLARRGENFRPRLVRALRDPATQAVTVVPPAPLPRVALRDPAGWDAAIGGMVAVMQGGTASRSAYGAQYTIAGKTGTAQVFSVAQDAKYDESAISERLRDHAWFIAFAPVEDPRIAVAVLVENGRSGSGTAAPIARTVMDAYLLRKFPPPPGADAPPAPDAAPVGSGE
ncbi:MAG: penicillin-binding protein 2 [Gammaproteobacteria bacterium]|nr:penicillin-binding protein 2 [Gammaproteobacteria bacterium]